MMNDAQDVEDDEPIPLTADELAPDAKGRPRPKHLSKIVVAPDGERITYDAVLFVNPADGAEVFAWRLR